MTVLDRYIRYRDAPGYLGMDRNRFDTEVRPTLTEIPIGERGIAFDRLDLDAWADDYKSRNGRPSRKLKETTACAQGQKASKSPMVATGLSISSTKESGYSPGSAKSPKTTQKPGSATSKAGSTQKLKDLLDTCSAMRQSVTS